MSTINACRTCGSSIRLGVMKVRVNGKRGVSQWFEAPQNRGCPCLKDWAWSVFKPYPKNPSEFEKRREAWNAENPSQ